MMCMMCMMCVVLTTAVIDNNNNTNLNIDVLPLPLPPVAVAVAVAVTAGDSECQQPEASATVTVTQAVTAGSTADRPLCVVPQQHNTGRLLTVATWDKKAVYVCNPALCDAGHGHGHGVSMTTATTPTQAAPKVGQPRWSQQFGNNYIDYINSAGTEGWVQNEAIMMTKWMTKVQHDKGIFGSVMEIGIYHGKYFGALAGYSFDNETLVAVDLFENQEENYDGFQGTFDSKVRFMKFLQAINIRFADMVILTGNSMTLTAKNFSNTEVQVSAFRIVSIDGGHSLETTLHDFNIAACLLMDGGVIVVDDFPVADWIGVTEAIVHITSAYANVAPFYYGHNKIWFTTVSHVADYYKLVVDQIGCSDIDGCSRPPRSCHVSRFTLGGFPMCYRSWTDGRKIPNREE